MGSGRQFLPFGEMNMFDFPLLALNGIWHYWTYVLVLSKALNKADGGFGLRRDSEIHVWGTVLRSGNHVLRQDHIS